MVFWHSGGPCRAAAAVSQQLLVRFLAASLLATTRFWYRCALSFVAEDEILAYLKDVPELVALP